MSLSFVSQAIGILGFISALPFPTRRCGEVEFFLSPARKRFCSSPPNMHEMMMTTLLMRSTNHSCCCRRDMHSAAREAHLFLAARDYYYSGVSCRNAANFHVMSSLHYWRPPGHSLGQHGASQRTGRGRGLGVGRHLVVPACFLPSSQPPIMTVIILRVYFLPCH